MCFNDNKARISTLRFLPHIWLRSPFLLKLGWASPLSLGLLSGISSLSLNLARVSDECLNPKEEVANCKIFYNLFFEKLLINLFSKSKIRCKTLGE